MIEINSERCKGCGLCVDVCPKKIIKIGNERTANGYLSAECTDNDKCISCKMCAVMCPDTAIRVFVRSKKSEVRSQKLEVRG